MTGDRPAPAESIDPDAVEAVVREALVVLGIAFLTGLALLVPGADRELPGVAVTIGEAIFAAGTTAIVGSLLYSIPRVRDLVSSAIVGPAGVVDDVSAVAGYLVGFAAVLVAHRGLEPVAVPMIGGVRWAYDQVFLLSAVVVLALVARRLYRSLDPIAGMVTRGLLEETGSETSATDAQG